MDGQMILGMGCWTWGLLIAGVIYLGLCLWSRSLKSPWPFRQPLDTPGVWQPLGQRDGKTGYPVPKQNALECFKPAPRNRTLRQAPGDPGRLKSYGMPVLHSTDELLRWLNLDFRSFIALADPSNRVRPGKSNYVEWSVPKKRRGIRIICSPKPRLKAVQSKIKVAILDRPPTGLSAIAAS